MKQHIYIKRMRVLFYLPPWLCLVIDLCIKLLLNNETFADIDRFCTIKSVMIAKQDGQNSTNLYERTSYNL